MKNYLLLISLVVVLAGCAGKQETIRYYTIDTYDLSVADTVEAVTYDPLPYSVEIVDFTVSGPYNDNRIALRTHTNELQYFHFHHWAEMPASMIRFFTWRVISETGLFEHAALRMSATIPDYLITGVIHGIERIDLDNDEAGARVSGGFELVYVRDGKTIVSHPYSTVVPFAANAPMNLFAREISGILYTELHAFVRLIATELDRK
jgi:ABC-type uncharacterized transport system auxiliary subunit